LQYPVHRPLRGPWHHTLGMTHTAILEDMLFVQIVSYAAGAAQDSA
jgi:hypothetical protein